MELNLRKSFSDGVQFAWDATSILAAQKCLRYYQYTILEGWRSNNPSVHLRFGGLYASALEQYHKLVAYGADWLDALEQVVHDALIATWEYELDEAGSPIPGTGQPWQSFDNTKTRETLIRTIVWYVDEFHDDDMPVYIQSDGTPAVEYSFSIDVGDDIVFCGHIDKVVEYSGDLYVTDQKTTGTTITPRYWTQFKPNTQMSMYTFAGQMIYSAPIKGVIIDAAQIAVGFSRFERSPTMRTKDELEEWFEDTMRYIELTRTATRENHFPMNPVSCTNYGGCAFQLVCSRSPSVRENFLRASFNQDTPWDPLERR